MFVVRLFVDCVAVLCVAAVGERRRRYVRAVGEKKEREWTEKSESEEVADFLGGLREKRFF